ncbi:hypothetical protein GCM10027578_14270 [Spirosoma luteolum]
MVRPRLLLSVSFFFLIQACLFAQAALTPTELRCENLVDPVGLETATPRLSWSLTGPERGIEQAAYHVLVASSAEKLARNEGDLWDSGVVTSDQSLWVSYRGQALTSRTVCYWKVSVRATSGTQSGWSTPAQWRMGLMQPADRLAQWTGLERTFDWEAPTAHRTRLAARYFRKETYLYKPIRQATAYVCGLGLYELFLNGNRVGTQVLAPGPTEYNKRVFYNTYDVTNLLHPGANALGITLGTGRFFRMRLNEAGLPETTHYGMPRFWLQLEVTYDDGSTQTVISDPSWKATADGPIRANNEYDGEEYDATRELTDWHKTGFDDYAWLQAEAVAAPASRLESQTNPPIRIMQTLRPRTIRPLRPGVYMLDMGQNMTGWLRMRISGSRGTRLTLRFGESLNGDGSLYTDNLRSAQQTDVYTLRGNGPEVWEPRFTYHGFRYVELTGFAQPPTVEQFDGCVLYDDMAQHGRLTTSDSLLNQIVRNADWGIKGNYQGIPTDCPQRDERHGWLGDRTTGARGESFLYNNQALYAKWLDDIQDAQSDQGSIPDVAPSYWKIYTDNITWPAAYVSVANMLYDQFGDDKPIRAHYDSMKKWLFYIDKYQHEYDYWRDEYGDWAVPPESPDVIITQDPTRKTPGPVLGSTHYYHILRLLERFATIVGNESDQAWFAQRAGFVKDAFNRNHWNAGLQQYANNTTTANVLPLAFDMVPADRRQRVIDNLVGRLTGEYGTHVSSGVVGVQWLMRTLTSIGRIDLAYQMSTQTTYPSLGYMAQRGATTIWELWNGDTANPAMNSGNHVMLLGDLLIWLYENVAGIKATSPAFRRISMHPTPVGKLTQVAASHTSPYGLIGSDWQLDGNTFRWTVTVPGNCRAEVAVPAGSPDQVWEGGQRAALANGVRLLRQEGDRIIFEVGSGTYVFSNAPRQLANLTVAMLANRRVVPVGEPIEVYLIVRNDGPETATNIQHTNHLPDGLDVVSTSGFAVTDRQLTGHLPQLGPGNQVQYTLLLRPTRPGQYIYTAQVTATDQADPTSTPNSGTGDGEDDMAVLDFRTTEITPAVYTSPNPNQRPLPPVRSNQPPADPAKADLSLQLATAQAVLLPGQPTDLSLTVRNEGGLPAGAIRVAVWIPEGAQIDGHTGSAGGTRLSLVLPGMVASGQALSLTVPLLLHQAGPVAIRAELETASVADPDSTPNNGTTNGEDDTAQLLLRTP